MDFCLRVGNFLTRAPTHENFSAMGCLSGDLYCCRKENEERQYPFLQEYGLLFFCWTVGAGALIVMR